MRMAIGISAKAASGQLRAMGRRAARVFRCGMGTLSATASAAILATAMLASPAEAEFRISFDWAGLKLCTSGRPNRVSNPAFKVTGVPEGTRIIRFKLTDLDVPGYNHGGGWVRIKADGVVPRGAFKYKSPCPPSGAHTYEWSAEARTAKNGDVRARASARRKYPE